MTVVVNAPDGSVVRFPDGTDAATIHGVMMQHFGSGAAQQQSTAPQQQAQQRAPNIFDQFDPPQRGGSPDAGAWRSPQGGNFFDQFDPPQKGATASQALPKLPAGFVLEGGGNSQAPALPPLPKGFQLEQGNKQMPIYEAETPHGSYEIDAPDMQTAFKALGSWQQSQGVRQQSDSRPIPQYFPLAGQMAQDSAAQFSRGVGQLASGSMFQPHDQSAPGANAQSMAEAFRTPGYDPRKVAPGQWNALGGLLNTVAGGLGYATAPINAAAEAFVGAPIEKATGIPREYTNFAALLATPGVGFTRIGRAADALGTAGAIQHPSQAMARAHDVADQARAAGIDLSKGQATQDFAQQQFENIAKRGGYGEGAQKVVGPFFDQQGQQIAQAGQDVGRQLAGGADRVENPLQVGEMLASRAADVHGQAEGLAQSALARGQNAIAPMLGTDAGTAAESTIDAVRNAAQAQRQNFKGLYADAFSRDGQFSPQAFQGIGDTIRADLSKGDSPVIVDSVTTPVAARALQDVDANIGQGVNQNLARPAGQPAQPPQFPERLPGTNSVSREQQRQYAADLAAFQSKATSSAARPLTLQDMDQARKRLVSFYQNTAPGTADRRAMGGVINSFDNHVTGTMETGLFRGDEGAITALKNARGAYRDYQTTFRPQGQGDDVGRVMQAIVDRNAQPNEVANYMYGSSAVGNTGLSIRLADRLGSVLGRDSPEWQNIQRGLVSRALGNTSDPAKVAQGISRLTEGDGRFLANKVLTPEQKQSLNNFRYAVQNASRAREAVPSDAAAGNFNPNSIVSNLMGTAKVGAKGSNAEFAMALRSYFGHDSPEFGAVRQGIFQRLTQKPAGVDQFGPQAISQRINEFLNGDGRSLASVVYTKDQQDAMRQLASAYKSTVPIKGAAPNSDTAPAVGSMVERLLSPKTQRIISLMMAASGFASHGPVGALGGYAIGSQITSHLARAREAANVARAKSAIAGMPAALPPQRTAPVFQLTGGRPSPLLLPSAGNLPPFSVQPVAAQDRRR